MMPAPADCMANPDVPDSGLSTGRYTSPAVAVEAHNLSKRYPGPFSFHKERKPGVLAVDQVTLTLEEGEIVGMVGPNGAGKTTFIRMLSTMVLPSSGTAKVGGFDVCNQDREVRRLVGVVSSNERSFYWRLNGRENLNFFADLHQIDTREAARWIEDLIELLNLGDVVQRRFDGYSTGEKQRMSIARGLLTRPKILLMDEPTKGVDPIGTAEIIDLIKTMILPLWRPTILVTSHNLTEVERLCSRVALMRKGRMLALDTVAALKRRVRTVEHYLITIRGLSAQRIEKLAVEADGHSLGCEVADAGMLNLEVNFSPGGSGFANLARGIIEAGGDLVSVNSSEQSFEQAFHEILATGGKRQVVEG